MSQPHQMTTEHHQSAGEKHPTGDSFSGTLSRRERVVRQRLESEQNDNERDETAAVNDTASTTVDQQLARSKQQLQQLQLSGELLVSNVPVAAAKRQLLGAGNDERCQSARQRLLHHYEQQQEQQVDRLTQLWQSVQSGSPEQLQQQLLSQKQLCDQTLADKDTLIHTLQKEIKCREQEYNGEIDNQKQDVAIMVQRMQQQLDSLRRAYASQLQLVYGTMSGREQQLNADSSRQWHDTLDKITQMERDQLEAYLAMNDQHYDHIQQVHQQNAEQFRQIRSSLQQDIALIQQGVEQLKASCIFNTEKLDYNYKILKRQTQESIATITKYRQSYMRLEETQRALRVRLEQQRDAQQTEITTLNRDIKRLSETLHETGERRKHSERVHGQQLQQLQQLQEHKCLQLLEQLQLSDRVVQQQILAIDNYQPPDNSHLSQHSQLPRATKNKTDRNGNRAIGREQEGGERERGEEDVAENSKQLERRQHQLLTALAEHCHFLVDSRLACQLQQLTAQQPPAADGVGAAAAAAGGGRATCRDSQLVRLCVTLNTLGITNRHQLLQLLPRLDRCSDETSVVNQLTDSHRTRLDTPSVTNLPPSSPPPPPPPPLVSSPVSASDVRASVGETHKLSPIETGRASSGPTDVRGETEHSVAAIVSSNITTDQVTATAPATATTATGSSSNNANNNNANNTGERDEDNNNSSSSENTAISPEVITEAVNHYLQQQHQQRQQQQQHQRQQQQQQTGGSTDKRRNRHTETPKQPETDSADGGADADTDNDDGGGGGGGGVNAAVLTREYWQRYLRHAPTTHQQLWQPLTAGLQQYHQLLMQRAAGAEQLQLARAENQQLRRMLKNVLQAGSA